MEFLIAAAIEAIAGAIGGNAISRILNLHSVSWVVCTVAGIAGGVGGGAIIESQIGDPITGNGVIHLFGLAVGGLVGGGILSGIVGTVMRGNG